jgi:hypothetical protein
MIDWIAVISEGRLFDGCTHGSFDPMVIGLFPCIVMVHGFHSHKDCLWSFPDEPNYQGSMMDQGPVALHRRIRDRCYRPA